MQASRRAGRPSSAWGAAAVRGGARRRPREDALRLSAPETPRSARGLCGEGRKRWEPHLQIGIHRRADIRRGGIHLAWPVQLRARARSGVNPGGAERTSARAHLHAPGTQHLHDPRQSPAPSSARHRTPPIRHHARAGTKASVRGSGEAVIFPAEWRDRTPTYRRLPGFSPTRYLRLAEHPPPVWTSSKILTELAACVVEWEGKIARREFEALVVSCGYHGRTERAKANAAPDWGGRDGGWDTTNHSSWWSPLRLQTRRGTRH
ncbi:Protein of unknown function [Gryllus bimaculatus]|nr:Protein of unknown function [Gryllus bimaculatus]